MAADANTYADDLKERGGPYADLLRISQDDEITGRIEAGLFPGNSTSIAYEASHVVKAAPGTLYGFSGYNSGPAQFVQLHDAISVPADTAVPVFVMAIPAASNFNQEWGKILGHYGRRFRIGIVICNSTTGPTKTIGSANCWFDVQYV